ncbi:Spy/CpxP family protein refolding chaperone [Rhodoplanes sp. Z2-YC6860]|uniref:Spy/CpxP family protein refolding chaperone n=1 Tax=Rhodoplanes sp. Z2-YC6860 TaxID=674703 RepID=UPI000833982A|nr:Spy/CpxP family protein refolding chaperone [Rhodoplanes sp. Z2-YC6860]
MINKTLAAGTIALLLAGASTGAVLAQSAPSRDHARSEMRMQDRAQDRAKFRENRAADVAAFTDARIAALKAGLKLNADQEKNWPAVETALRDLAKDRAMQMNARAERREAARANVQGNDQARPAPDAIARMRDRADAMTARAAGLKKLADASEPLYKSLDDGQKHRFSALIRMGGRGGMEHHHWRRG